MKYTYVALNYKWILSSKKLNDLKNKKCLYLEKFLCKTSHGDWSLKIWRKESAKAASDSFSLVVERDYLKRPHTNVIRITINLYTIKPTQHILQKHFEEALCRRCCVELNLGNHLQETIENSTELVISGRVFIKTKFRFNIENGPTEVVVKPSDELSSDFSKLCCNEFGADVILTCNLINFPAHKLILTTRCPYFAELFQHSNLSQICIMDLKPNVLKAVLFFIYSANTEPLTQELACDLLTASITYKLRGLKVICLNYLKSIMTIENAIPIYVFAAATDEELRILALKYISSYFTFIENTSEWQNLLKEKPAMATQILSSIVKSIDSISTVEY